MTSFGEHLRQAREARNITLQEIAASTKIGSRSLQALEDEQFDQLPGGIFNKGFVRAYARYVGLDEEETVAAYIEAARATTPETDLETMSIQVKPSVTQESSGFNAATVVSVLALIVALGLGGLWWREQRKEAREQAASQVASQVVQQPVPAPVTVPPAPPDVSTANPVQDTPQAGATPSSAGTTSADTAPAPSSSQSSEKQAEPVEVSIQATQRAWISVRSDGKSVESVTLDPDNPELRSRSYKAKEKLLLVVGNPAGLTVTYNGKPAGTLGTEGHRAIIAFTPQGIEKQ